MKTVAEIEQAMAMLATVHPNRYRDVKKEYDRLLAIMGNVDGDEVLQLVLVACSNVETTID